MNFPATDDRAAQRLRWARDALNDENTTLERASIDAGFRSYWRSRDAGGTHMVMDSPPGTEDVKPWLKMRDLLESGGVRVPQVLAQDVERGFLLLEDLGGPTLAQVIDAETADGLFDGAMDELVRLQQIAPPADMGEFGEALLQRDAGLFEEWFLQRHLGLQLDCGLTDRIELVQRRLMDNLLAQKKVLTHRDYMPRNLMPLPDGPAVLDFQDCVRGPIGYDAMSLFKDAFLSWPLERVDGWIAQYHAKAQTAGLPVPALDVFRRDADWCGVQRHLKILGIFCRLHYRDGKSKYIADLPRFVAYLDEVLPRHRELQPLREVLDENIKPALATKAATA